MAENYNYQYIENIPQQQLYTNKNEVIYQYPTTKATATNENYITYEVPKTKTTTHNPQNVQYQAKIKQPIPQQIYTIEPNKTKAKNQEYIYEYPPQNIQTNQQVYQNNNYQNIINTNNTKANYNNINYGAQQVQQVKPNKNDINKYIIPQTNIITQKPKEIKQNIQYQQNQHHHHQHQPQQYIYQNNNINYVENKNNAIPQYQQKIQQQIQPKIQTQIQPKQNKTINQLQKINPQLNQLNPKTQIISNVKNNPVKNYQIPQQHVLQKNQIINQKNPVQVIKNKDITNNQESLIIPAYIPNQNQQKVITTNQQIPNQNQNKINIFNQPQLQNKLPNQNIQKNIHPEIQHEHQKYQAPIKYNQPNQMINQNKVNVIPPQHLGNNVQIINPQQVNNNINNNIINQNHQNLKIMPKMQVMPIVQNNNNINNQNIVLNNNNNNPQVNLLKNIPPQNQFNQIPIQNIQNNNNAQYKLDSQSVKLNHQSFPTQQNPNNIQPQIIPQNMTNSQKLSNLKAHQNLIKQKKELSAIKEEESYIKQSGFDTKENKITNEELNQKKEIEKNIDNNFKESKPPEPNNITNQNNEIDIDDTLERLPLIDNIMKGLADLLPPCKRKKYV